MGLDVAVLEDPLTVTVRCIGELDMATTPRVKKTVDRVLEESQSKIRLDLSGIDFMGSEGLVLITSTLKACRKRGVALDIIPSPRVTAVLQVAGLSGPLSEVLKESRLQTA